MPHASHSSIADPIYALLPSVIERERYATLLETLASWKPLFTGHRVLDFGASWGTSLIALSRLGASEIVGVEPSPTRVERGRKMLAKATHEAKISLINIQNTAQLPFANGEFKFILVNGVLEHIPQPRDPYIRELWRVLAPHGHLMVNETPNKYFPKELHTTALWFNHWLPRQLAYWRAVRYGRFDPNRTDWDSSGWRGLGYFEFVKPLNSYRLIPEQSKRRHRMFKLAGLPSSLLDPYPTWILQKTLSR